MYDDKYKAPELSARTAGYYADPTAYSAFNHRRENLHREYEKGKLSVAMMEVRGILKRYGFVLEERIKVKSRRTGTIYE